MDMDTGHKRGKEVSCKIENPEAIEQDLPSGAEKTLQSQAALNNVVKIACLLGSSNE